MKQLGMSGLIPHEPPARLIDEILASDEASIVCGARVTADNPYVHMGKARSVVCIEYMAQAIAAFWGERAGRRGKPRVGYLIAASELTLFADALDEGDVLRIEARRVWGDCALGKFDCSVSRGGTMFARASLSVFMPGETSGTAAVVS